MEFLINSQANKKIYKIGLMCGYLPSYLVYDYIPRLIPKIHTLDFNPKYCSIAKYEKFLSRVLPNQACLPTFTHETTFDTFEQWVNTYYKYVERLVVSSTVPSSVKQLYDISSKYITTSIMLLLVNNKNTVEPREVHGLDVHIKGGDPVSQIKMLYRSIGRFRVKSIECNWAVLNATKYGLYFAYESQYKMGYKRINDVHTYNHSRYKNRPSVCAYLSLKNFKNYYDTYMQDAFKTKQVI